MTAQLFTPLLDSDEFTYGLQFMHKGHEMVVTQWKDWEANSFQISVRYVKPDGTVGNIVNAKDETGTQFWTVVRTSEGETSKNPGLKDDMELYQERVQKVLDLVDPLGESEVSPNDYPFEGTNVEKVTWMVEKGFDYVDGKLKILHPAEQY